MISLKNISVYFNKNIVTEHIALRNINLNVLEDMHKLQIIKPYVILSFL